MDLDYCVDTMKMAGASNDPMHQNRPWGLRHPAESDSLCDCKHYRHGRCLGRETSPAKKLELDYHVTSPAIRYVMKKSPSLQTRFGMSVVPKHKDGMGKASSPCIADLWDTTPHRIRQPHARTVFMGRSSVTCFRVGTDPT